MGLEIVPDTPYNVLTALGMLIKSITSDHYLYLDTDEVEVSGIKEDGTVDSVFDEFPKLLMFMQYFRNNYNAGTHTNTFIFNDRNRKKLMKSLLLIIEEYINSSNAEPERIASEISRYFYNITPIPTLEAYAYNDKMPENLTDAAVMEALSSIDYGYAMRNRSALRTEWEESSGNCTQQIAYVRVTTTTIGIRPTYEVEIWRHIADNPKKLTEWKFMPNTDGVKFTSPYGFIASDNYEELQVYYVLVEVNIPVKGLTKTLGEYLGITDRKKVSAIKNFVARQTETINNKN